jgi:hypothetical protein
MIQRLYSVAVVAAVLALGVSLSRYSAPNAGLRHAVPQETYQLRDSGHGSYEGRNAAQNLTMEFSAREAQLKDSQGSGGFRLAGYGYGERLRTPAEAKVVAAGNRLEYRRGELTEWYVNEARGVEQGFTFAKRPAGTHKGGPLVVALAVTGGLDPALTANRDVVLLQSRGREVFRYGGLKSWDARGREIASRLEVRDREIRLVVDDRDAEYPLVVDPLVMTLAPGSPYTVGMNPISVAVGDFNKDGHPDLAVANVSSNNVTIRRGNTSGNGGFAATGAVTISGISAPRAIAVGDFNNDTWDDLVVVDSQTMLSPGGISVLINNAIVNPVPSFSAPVTYTAGATPEAVAVGDFNKDGCPDIAVTNNVDNTVSVFLNIPGGGTGCTGTFNPVTAATTFPVGAGPSGILAGDFNNDGFMDLAVVDSFAPGTTNASVTILLNNHNPITLFNMGTNYSLGPASRALNGAQNIAAGDFNHDTFLDLAVATDLGVVVLLNNGAGGFPSQMTFSSATDRLPAAVGVGDFNGDGILDLVVANAYSANVGIFLGNGTGGIGNGTFQPPVNFPVGFLPVSLAVGAFKGVGPADDVAVANFASNNVTVYLSAP